MWLPRQKSKKCTVTSTWASWISCSGKASCHAVSSPKQPCGERPVERNRASWQQQQHRLAHHVCAGPSEQRDPPAPGKPSWLQPQPVSWLQPCGRLLTTQPGHAWILTQSVVNRVIAIPPKDIRILLPGTCEYVTLHDNGWLCRYK